MTNPIIANDDLDLRFYTEKLDTGEVRLGLAMDIRFKADHNSGQIGADLIAKDSYITNTTDVYGATIDIVFNEDMAVESIDSISPIRRWIHEEEEAEVVAVTQEQTKAILHSIKGLINEM